MAIQHSLVVPLHDEAARVEGLLAQVLPWCREAGRELVLVDDGSRDGTRERLLAFRAAHPELNLQVLSQPAEGKGGAVRSGVLAARGEAVVFTDADLPFGLAGVERALQALDGGADVAVGARDLPGSRVGPTPLLRRAASQVFRSWVRLVLDTGEVVDTQCGLKGFRRAVIEPLFGALERRDFSFDLELLGLARARGLRVVRVPVEIAAWERSTVVLRRAAPALLLGSLGAARAVRRRSGAAPLDRRELWLPLALALAVGLAMAHGFGRWGGRDWDQLQADLIAARGALLQGELPLWMPYRAGGHDALADPSSLWCSPLGLLALVLGPAGGIRAFAALAAAATGWGALELGRALGLCAPGRAGVAALLGGGAPLGLYMAGGIPTFTLGLALLPWLTLLLLRGRPGGLVLAGGLLALGLYGGDVNHFVFHAVWAGLVSVGLALARREPRRLAGLAVTGVAAAVLSGPKLVPMALLARERPRATQDELRGALSWRLLGHALLDRQAVRFVEGPWREFVVLERGGGLSDRAAPESAVAGSAVDWVDTGSYVGPLALALAALGLMACLRGRGPPARGGLLPLLVAAGLLLWLGFGRNAWLDAWGALHHLPPFSSLRSPARLVLYPWFVLALLAGVGLDLVHQHLARRRVALGGALLVALLLGDVFPPAWRAYRQTFVEPDPGPIEAAGFLTVAGRRPEGSSYYGPPVAPFAAVGVGVSNGYCAVPTEPRAVPVQDRARYRGESFLETGEGRVRGLVVGSRRVRVELEARGPARLVVNQNWAAGWAVEAPAGARCGPHPDGRILVELPAGGAERVVLRYTSPGLTAGALLLLLGLPPLLFLAGRLPAPREAA